MEHKSGSTWPQGQRTLTLSLVFLVASGVLVLSVLLTNSIANYSIDIEPPAPAAPIFNKPTDTQVSPTETEVFLKETPVSPTRTAPTLEPTEIQPTPTVVTVYNEWGWPVLVDMPGDEMQPADAGHAGHVGLSPITTDVETSLLIAYTDPDVTLPDGLQRMLEYVYPDEEFFAVNSDTGEPILRVDKPANSESVDFIFPSDYIYYKLTGAEVCQLIEAANLEGYGLAGQPGQTLQEAFEILIFQYGDRFGRTSSMIFYCSNFDPASPDFLSIALDLGYVDLVAKLQK